MTYLQFIKHISNPLGVALFPASGNLYYNQIRVGYLDFNRHTEEQEVNFFRPASIPVLYNITDTEGDMLRALVKELSTLAVIHGIDIRDISC